MADVQDDYVQIDKENGDDSSQDKDAYIEQLQAKITALEETNKQQKFELQRAIHASYGSGDGDNEEQPTTSETELNSMTTDEIGQQLLRTQQFLNKIKNERDRLQYQLADMQVADQKLRRRLSEQFAEIPKENKDLASFIQYMIAEEQMSHLEELKKAKDEMELEFKKMQYEMADEKYEKIRLAKEKELKEKQLEYDIAEARYNEMKTLQNVKDVSTENGGDEAMNPVLLDPNELGKQLKDEIDKIKYRFAEEKLKGIKLKEQNEALETELRLEREKISAMHSRFSQESILQVNKLLKYSQHSEHSRTHSNYHSTPHNSKIYGQSAPSSPTGSYPPPPPLQNKSKDGQKSDLNGGPSQFAKQQSHQMWTDSQGHTREVSMPGFHKQFTMSFEEEINDLSGRINTNDGGIDPNDPSVSMELKKAYLEIQQLQKQLAQFTEQARDERALIWEKPRLTIQQISTFLRKLPDKHKEKMWERHCMGEYVKTDKVGSLLFSIVALCIKIHDRNVKTPQKGALLKKLEPYTKLIQSQISQKDDPIGLTQEDFNDNLHEWLLLPLPIENLLSSTDREKLESELFETKKQLIEKDKEIFKERRKSKIFQESLAEIQKEAEKYEKDKVTVEDNTEENEEWKRRASEVMGEKDQLKLEIVEKDRTIDDLNDRLQELEEQVNNLNASKTRDSEDDLELPDRQPNGVTYFSQHSISASENPFEEEKIDYSVNDSNVTKSDIYIGWKKKAEKMQELLNLEKENNKELQMKIAEYETMAEAYRSLQADNSAWKEKVQKMTDKMNEFDRTHQDANRPVRRESIAALHSSIAKGVVYAEAEHEKIVSGYERQIHNLTGDLTYITNGFEKYKMEIDEKISNLEDSVRLEERNKYEMLMNEQKHSYQNQLNEQENQRSQLQATLNGIKQQLINATEMEQENIRLTDEIDQMRRNKQACMEAAAESMNQYREIVLKLNQKIRILSS